MPHSSSRARRFAIVRRFARNGGLAQHHSIEACLKRYLSSVIRALVADSVSGSTVTPAGVAMAVARSQGLKLP